MKSRKILAFLLVFCLTLAVFPLNAFALKNGDKLGDVLHSDIKAYINGARIPSYNVEGNLAVKVSDLNNYNFKTTYSESERTTKIVWGGDKAVSPLTVNDSTSKPGTVAGSYVYSDITAYVNGKKVDSFNIDGYLVIYFSALDAYGTRVFDPQAKTSKLTVKGIAEKPGGSLTYNDKDAYLFTELSEKDMKAFKDAYNDEIRYIFEQWTLPDCIFGADDKTVDIKSKGTQSKDFVEFVWNYLLTQVISQIQNDSTDAYIFPDDASDAMMYVAYLVLLKQTGLEAKDMFDLTYVTLKDKSNMLLITFKKTDTLIACKYIGIVVRNDDSKRYFTAETDPYIKDALFLGEVTPDRRGTYDKIGFEQKDFISAIETVLEQNLKPIIEQRRLD